MIKTDSDRCKRYYSENRASILSGKKQDRMARLGVYNQRGRARRASNLKSWEGFIPQVAECQMCGVDIYFNCGNRRKAIHFDHRHGERHNFRTPYQFLARCSRTPKSEALWKSFDFGMLCMGCNTRMPTENRTQFIKNAVKYMNLRSL